MRLENKVALITGAASGMGASMARIFAGEGAKVVVADVLEAEGKAGRRRHHQGQWRGDVPPARREQRGRSGRRRSTPRSPPTAGSTSSSTMPG